MKNAGFFLPPLVCLFGAVLKRFELLVVTWKRTRDPDDAFSRGPAWSSETILPRFWKRTRYSVEASRPKNSRSLTKSRPSRKSGRGASNCAKAETARRQSNKATLVFMAVRGAMIPYDIMYHPPYVACTRYQDSARILEDRID